MTPQQLEDKLKRLVRKVCCLTDLVNTLTTTSTTTTTTATPTTTTTTTAPSDVRLKKNIKPTGRTVTVTRYII